MSTSFLKILTSALGRGEINPSIDVLRAWLATASAGEPEELIASCPKEDRPRLVLLLRDLLSRFPATILGAPVLLHCTFPGNPVGHQFRLPHPLPVDIQPCPDLRFIGWISLDTKLPVNIPLQPRDHAFTVPAGEVTGAIALFRADPDVFDQDVIDLPNSWWDCLFTPLGCQVMLSARLLLAYPDALEAGRAMLAAASNKPLPDRQGFASEATKEWARNAGLLFQETFSLTGNLHARFASDLDI